MSDSKFAMDMLIVDWLLLSFRAAAENDPNAAASVNATKDSGGYRMRAPPSEPGLCNNIKQSVTII